MLLCCFILQNSINVQYKRKTKGGSDSMLLPAELVLTKNKQLKKKVEIKSNRISLLPQAHILVSFS